MNSKRVAYSIFTAGDISGTGVLTRAEAVARVFAARNATGIDFQIFGTVDRGSVPNWLPTVKTQATLVEPGPDANAKLIDELLYYEADLLLVDSYPVNLLPLLKDKKFRPPNVWGVMRHTPGALGTDGHYSLPYGIFDRLYQIEPSNHGLYMWDDGIARERVRSIAEKEAGVKDRNYQEPPPATVEEFHRWPEHYRRHRRDSRKLIAPVVNVEPGRVLSREESRATLLSHAGLSTAEYDSEKPLVLIAFSTTPQEYVAAQPWMKGNLIDWGVYRRPEEERLLVQAGAFYPKLAELWRYLPGVDYLLSSAGYNSFYEARYLAALGKFTGKAAFWPIHGYPEQVWRAERQTGFFSGQSYPEGMNPVENGADYITDCIIRKFS
jgi:hypothetical protein